MSDNPPPTNIEKCFKVNKKEDLPSDTVQCIEFMPVERSAIFAVGSWDGRFRVYEVFEGSGYNSQPEIGMIFGYESQRPYHLYRLVE